jgi:iron complex transport system substrate-binding protein
MTDEPDEGKEIHHEGILTVRRKTILVCMPGLIAALLLAACATRTPAAGPTAAPSPSAAGYPVTVADCNGINSTYHSAPKRVVTLAGSSELELMYWLGLGDRIIATGFRPEPGTFPPQFDAAAQGLPKLSGKYEAGGSYKPPPKEELLSLEPDFVISGFSSSFDAEGAVAQKELAEGGTNSYLMFSTECDSARNKPLEDLSLVYRDIDNLGKIFRVQERAAELISQMQTKVSSVQQRLQGVTDRPKVFAFEFDEGAETPLATGNRQTINAVIELAGGRNVFSDLDKGYENVNWEEIIKRDPDVILIITYGTGNDAENAAGIEKAKAFLSGFAPIQNLRVVQEQRYGDLLYGLGSVGGVRNADAVETLASILHPDLVKPGS